jgi:hypothetical protein
MNVDKAIHTLIAVATALFSEGSQVVTDPEASSIKPKETIDLMFETRERHLSAPECTSGPVRNRDARWKPPPGDLSLSLTPNSVPYAANPSNIRHPRAFRTYSFRCASPNPTTVEAI